MGTSAHLLYRRVLVTYYFSLHHSSKTNRLIYTGLAPIASFFLVLYLDHIRIEGLLRNSGIMSSFFCMQFICAALYLGDCHYIQEQLRDIGFKKKYWSCQCIYISLRKENEDEKDEEGEEVEKE